MKSITKKGCDQTNLCKLSESNIIKNAYIEWVIIDSMEDLIVNVIVMLG